MRHGNGGRDRRRTYNPVMAYCCGEGGMAMLMVVMLRKEVRQVIHEVLQFRGRPLRKPTVIIAPNHGGYYVLDYVLQPL